MTDSDQKLLIDEESTHLGELVNARFATNHAVILLKAGLTGWRTGDSEDLALRDELRAAQAQLVALAHRLRRRERVKRWKLSKIRKGLWDETREATVEE